MIEVRRVYAGDWRQWREMRLQALKDAPYAFATLLEQWQGDGDLEQRWRARLDDVELNLIAYLDQEPAGMVSGSISTEELELISMWVAPFARGRAVGDALIEAVIDYAGTVDPSDIRLSVMVGNDRAIALYGRHGFVDAGENTRDVGPGERAESWMVRRNVSASRESEP
jgi:ribosomal protein S18 acetylase RimI-like enzyme